MALLASAAALTASLVLPAQATVYLDVRAIDWFAPAVNYVVQTGLFAGVETHLFAPRQSMSRAMFYTVLSRVAGIQPDNQAASNLTDVPVGRWYTGAVVWAVSQGIAGCDGDTVFGVDREVSRAELCLALARYDRILGLHVLPASGSATFLDLGGCDEETRHAISVCQAAGVIQGREDSSFDPHAGASRAEVAQIIQNFCQLPGQAELDSSQSKAQSWDTVVGWTGNAAVDFPLSALETVTAEHVNWLNKRILNENTPAVIARYGETLDGNPKHLTNYGSGGLYDCIAVSTILYNKNNKVDAGVSLDGRQEYYGYSLQTNGVTRQDPWRQAAQDSGKDPWQCTWWAWGRAAQYLELAHGLDLKAVCNGKDNLGHGRDYYRSLKDHFLSDQTPSANSIVSWTCGGYGHVAYVEAVDEGGIWVSMSDSGHTWRGVTYIPRTDSKTNPYPLSWYPSETFNGFNHLDYASDGSPVS